MINNSVIMNPKISIRAILLSERLTSQLKFNTASYVTKSSREVINRTIQMLSTGRYPVKLIKQVGELIMNGDYQNVAISTLLCHLFYLRLFRLIFRLIRQKQPNERLFIRLLATSGTLLGDCLLRCNFASHRELLTMLFTMKANLTIREMFDLQQINRYWKNHRPRLNQHHVYRAWL